MSWIGNQLHRKVQRKCRLEKNRKIKFSRTLLTFWLNSGHSVERTVDRVDRKNHPYFLGFTGVGTVHYETWGQIYSCFIRLEHSLLMCNVNVHNSLRY